MSKHTPGPWSASSWHDEMDDVFGWSITSCGRRVPLSGYESNSMAEAEANARLIAAAPDLLAALERIADETAATWVCDVARAAIAKATGEQP